LPVPQSAQRNLAFLPARARIQDGVSFSARITMRNIKEFVFARSQWPDWSLTSSFGYRLDWHAFALQFQ